MVPQVPPGSCGSPGSPGASGSSGSPGSCGSCGSSGSPDSCGSSLETTSGYLSIDHIFKVAANLGYVRPDGHWVSQYKSVLIVLNDKGKIIA